METKIKEYLNSVSRIWCKNKNEWETNDLKELPSGDFIDNHNHIHSKKNHIKYISYEDIEHLFETLKIKL